MRRGQKKRSQRYNGKKKTQVSLDGFEKGDQKPRNGKPPEMEKEGNWILPWRIPSERNAAALRPSV